MNNNNNKKSVNCDWIKRGEREREREVFFLMNSKIIIFSFLYNCKILIIIWLCVQTHREYFLTKISFIVSNLIKIPFELNQCFQLNLVFFSLKLLNVNKTI